MEVNIHTAKTHLSRLLKRVAAGEEIVISRGDTPIAKLVGIAQKDLKRQPGRLLGRMKLTRRFFALDAEIEAEFDGGK